MSRVPWFVFVFVVVVVVVVVVVKTSSSILSPMILLTDESNETHSLVPLVPLRFE